jgi:hypothetical protein
MDNGFCALDLGFSEKKGINQDARDSGKKEQDYPALFLILAFDIRFAY